jgi:hypothetical protein
MADDPHVVRSLIEQSRDAAWGDVEANLQRRLQVEGMRPDLDPDYERMRAARMQSIRLVDIPRLAAHKRHREEAETDAERAPEPAAASPRVSGIDVTELDS